MKRSLVLAACLMVLGACSSSSDLTAPQRAGDVRMTLTLTDGCPGNVCNLAPNAAAIGRLVVTNTGGADAFLGACGAGVALSEQVLVGSTWQFVGPAVDCAFPSTPIRLGAGQHLEFDFPFAPGVRRLLMAAGQQPTLSDGAVAASNGVMVL